MSWQKSSARLRSCPELLSLGQRSFTHLTLSQDIECVRRLTAAPQTCRQASRWQRGNPRASRRTAPLGRRSIQTQAKAADKGLDAVIVLGGGLLSDGGLPEWVRRRLDVSRRLFEQEGSSYLLCLGSGTPHKPAVLRGQHVYHEAVACAEYLIEQGVAAERILKETSSYDTVGNAYFAVTIHAVPAEWRRCAVVTSAFHMARTQAIFEKCFALAGVSLWGDPDRFKLRFEEASDDGIFPEAVLLARQEKEGRSLKDWHHQSARLHSLKSLHEWLHATHLCYSVSRQADFGVVQGNGLDSTALESY